MDLLLEEDGTESRVESTKTLSAVDLAESRDETSSELRVRHETNTGSLERAEGNVGEELGGGRGGEVDGSTVVDSVLNTNLVDELLLEEFVSSKLEGTLEEVTSKGGTSTSEKSASTLVCDDLSEATDQTSVICDGVELNSCLDAINEMISFDAIFRDLNISRQAH
jgi:hypothetical protein